MVTVVEPVQQFGRSQLLGACPVVGALALGEHLSAGAGRAEAKEPCGVLEHPRWIRGQASARCEKTPGSESIWSRGPPSHSIHAMSDPRPSGRHAATSWS